VPLNLVSQDFVPAAALQAFLEKTIFTVRHADIMGWTTHWKCAHG